jgi:hypothetical protein
VINAVHRPDRAAVRPSRCRDENPEAFARLVKKNEDLQAEIKVHLRKVIGSSLFHAFDTRRRWLGLGKWIWAAILLLAVIAGCLLSAWLAKSITGGGLEFAFFVKLSAVIPISFAIFFAARQHGNERRTEEEYALDVLSADT